MNTLININDMNFKDIKATLERANTLNNELSDFVLFSLFSIELLKLMENNFEIAKVIR